MTGTAERLLRALKREGPQPASALAEASGLSLMGAHKQLKSLHAQALVDFRDESGQPGRPRRVWSLTPAGHAQFADRHAELTAQLLRHAGAAFGQDALDRLLAARENETAESYDAALAGAQTLGTRVRRLADMRATEGYMAHAEREGRVWLLIEDHCPIRAAACACEGFCRSELALFQHCLGAGCSVERTEHLLGGARRCVYRIRSVT